MKRSVRFIFILYISAIVISGCKQDLANATWDVDVIAPVINTELNMADLVADSLLESAADGALRLKVELPLIDLPLDSLLKIPDTTISKEITAQFNFNNIPPGFILPSLTDESTFQLGDMALKKVRVRSGKLQLHVRSVVNTTVEFEYRIPKATRAGNMFISAGSVDPGSSSSPSEVVYDFDLSGYEIDLTGLDGFGFNTLSTSFVINTAADGDTVTIPSGTTFIVLEYSFSDLVPDYGIGYFGQQTNSVEDQESDLEVLDRITDGQMFLDSVTIGLHIVNGVGADAKFKLSRLSSINTRTGNTVDLSHQLIGNNVLLSRAIDLSGTAASVIPYTVDHELNNANSNIKAFIENLPTRIGYSFSFDLNPLGNVSGGNDFFYYDRPFEALMDIDVPLRARLDGLTLVDTVDWDLGQNRVVESVNSGSFTLKALNGLPLQGTVELLMLDENLNNLGTLVAPSTVQAATLNTQNIVDQPMESIIDIPIPESLADVLPNTRKVRIRVQFSTAGQPELIEFYSDYSIHLKLIGKFNLNFSPSSL